MRKCSAQHSLLKSTSSLSVTIVIASALLLSGAGGLHAQQSSIKVGESDLYPNVRIDYESINNAFRNSANEIEATGIRVAPSAVLVANKRGLEVKTGYSGAYASYSEDELNYDDHYLYGSVDAVISSRKRLGGSAFFNLKHEALGTNFTRGDTLAENEQVETANFGLSTYYRFGAPTARINVTGGIGLNSTTYQNRKDVTQGRDYVAISPFGRLSYRLSADTRALLELGVRNVTFDNSLLDRNELRVLAGLAFRGTGKSGGDAKIGVASSSYGEGGPADTSVLAADIGLYFTPSKFSRFDLNIQRSFNDEDGTNLQAGSVQTIDDTASIKWRNQWSGFVSSTAFLELETQNRDCPTSSTQNLQASFEVAVKPRRWIEVGAGFSNTNRSADSCAGADSTGLEYDVQTISVFLDISL